MSQPLVPYVVVAPEGLVYVGLHTDEDDCWQIFLGWPSEAEIENAKKLGYYCTTATVSYNRIK